MKRKVLFSFIAILLFSVAFAQDACHPKHEGKLRIFGDSWAAFPFVYRCYDSAFAMFGLPEYRGLGDKTAIISMTSESFLLPIARIFWEPEIEKDVRNHVDAMVLTLAGNDLAFKAHVGDSANVLDEPFKQIKLNMDTLLDYLIGKIPDLQILWTCYDYPNFLDPLLDYPWDPYFDLWDSRGRPAPWQINEVVQRIAYLQDSLTQVWGRPYVHFYNNLGLMQYMFGQLTPLRAWPWGTYPPRSVPFPGGNPDYPTPYPAMGLNGLDTYHLNGPGFTYLAAYQMRVFFFDHFRKTRDTTVYSMGQSYDGWVSETGTTGTGEVQVGKNSGNIKIKGIFSFNTAFIPADKVIKRASLFIKRRDGSYHTNPDEQFPTNFKLDIQSGTFGTDQIEASDFNESASASDIACFAGQPVLPDYALRMDLLPQALPYINKNGITQFRLEITSDTAQGESIINFFNGDTANYEGPFLDLYYDTTTVTGIKQNLAVTLNLFPNPAKDKVYIAPDKKMKPGSYSCSIYDEKGALISSSVLQVSYAEIPVDVSSLQSGTYIIKLTDKAKVYSASFVKGH